MSKCLDPEVYCSIDQKEYTEYVEEVKSKYPNDMNKRYEYAFKIMPGQLYLYYLVDELQQAALASAYPYGECKKIHNVTFSIEAVETLLRSMYFMLDHMHDGLSEHNYNYIKSKSSAFFNQLKDSIKDNVKILEEA